MASRGPEIEAHVMGHPKGGAQEGHQGQLGACPFSHRVLLTLEEKQVPYCVNFVDVRNKPAWVSKVNPQGTLPIIRDLTLDQFIVDSDTIADYLEEKYCADEEADRKRLGKASALPHPGEEITAKFMSFLKAQGEGPAEKEELRAQLQEASRLINGLGAICKKNGLGMVVKHHPNKAIDDALSDRHPFMGGTEVNAWDLALAPRLHIARVGCKGIKGWDFAQDYDEVKAYLHRMMGRASWRNTASYDDDSIVEDLRAKLAES